MPGFSLPVLESRDPGIRRAGLCLVSLVGLRMLPPSPCIFPLLIRTPVLSH